MGGTACFNLEEFERNWGSVQHADLFVIALGAGMHGDQGAFDAALWTGAGGVLMHGFQSIGVLHHGLDQVVDGLLGHVGTGAEGGVLGKVVISSSQPS